MAKTMEELRGYAARLAKRKDSLAWFKQALALLVEKTYVAHEGQVVQMVGTPFKLCDEIVGKLREYAGEQALREMSVLVLNIEFLPEITRFAKEVTFIADNIEKAELVRELFPNVRVLRGSFLALKEKDMTRFKVVVGNPPYQNCTKTGEQNRAAGGRNTLWDKFVELAIDNVCEDGGYICLVHPAGWRGLKALEKVGGKIRSRQVKYLEIHDVQDGMKTFGAGTRYDWYVLKNSPKNKGQKTTVKTQSGKLAERDLDEYPIVPNDYCPLLDKVFAATDSDKLEVMQNSSYHTCREYMNKNKTGKYIFPCVNHVDTSNTPSFHYSSTQEFGQFGIPKVIFARMASGVMIDEDGEYGITEAARAIVAPRKVLTKIAEVMRSKEFIEFCKMLAMGSKDRYEIHTIRHFKKDFWKEFV